MAAIAVLVGCDKAAPVDPDLDPAKSAEGTFYEWPEYTSVINYDFSQNAEDFVEPTENLPYAKYFRESKKKELTMEYSYGSWSYFAGPNANALVKEDTLAVQLMLEQLEEDSKYIRAVNIVPTDDHRAVDRKSVV